MTLIDGSLRERLLGALMQAIGLGVAGSGCGERTIDDTTATDPMTLGATTDAAGTSGAATDASTTAPTSDSSTAPTTGEPLCQPPGESAGVFCLPRPNAGCQPCESECQNSVQAEEMANKVVGGCCFFSLEILCGPVEVDNECCYTAEVNNCGCDGRPLVVDGLARRAPPARRRDWLAELDLAQLAAAAAPERRAAAAARWTRAALDEHASIASFARFGLQLLALAAPASLLTATHAALGDEIEHARAAFAVAAALHGRPVGPGRLPEAVADGLATTLEDVALATFHDGCVGETVAAAIAAVAAARCGDAGLRELLGRIADDELRHAALAWQTLRWALDQPGSASLRRALHHITAPTPALPADADDLAELGCLSARDEARITAEVWQGVIGPSLHGLLGSSAAAPSRSAAA